MEFKVNINFNAILDTNQFPFWPSMGIEDLENMAKEAAKEALNNHFQNIIIKKVKVGL